METPVTEATRSTVASALPSNIAPEQILRHALLLLTRLKTSFSQEVGNESLCHNIEQAERELQVPAASHLEHATQEIMESSQAYEQVGLERNRSVRV